eukprot:TRINITY_DN12026_c0_g1_i1.p1 TRINITY_DN12026_c0_g1~~TRINITY_DN12026_c0_g1_i1.p1  ORF type:complete len:135 (+),score=44.13 TRINITY_DN12026_c0_g1_i1:96-500(+)
MYNPFRPVATRMGNQLLRRAEAAAGKKVNADAVETVYVAPSVVHEEVRVLGGTTDEGYRQLGIQWRAGWTERLAKENAETNQALIARLKSGNITVGEVVDLAKIGAAMFAAGAIGVVAGRRKLFGWRNDPAAHH